MCRNIRKLRNPEREPADAELRDAALQFVRKISGYREPSNANREAFENAVDAVSEASRVLFESLNKEKKVKKVRVG
ncbi:DUF2277 domain-containing protein [bacterium]|nr:DUF2277 domain-containing protein [bacterium]MCI0617702.1 DUF2277 domain-containing protein [bacterium]